jgi:hypothetical protein
MLLTFLDWLQNGLGKGKGEDAQSWSQALLGSLNFWNLLEGTHLLMLMLFAGTIFLVDLRLLGVAFKKTRVSVISARVLPLTVAGFGLMVLTGLALFFAKPVPYYHNLWFRLKLVFLAVAMINIVVFHYRVQKDQAAWDTAPKPPTSARISAVVSLSSWVLVILMGRLIAYNFVECGKPLPAWVNAVEECQTSEHGAQSLDGHILIKGLDGKIVFEGKRP